MRIIRLLPHDLEEANRVASALKPAAATASTDVVRIDLLRGDVLCKTSN